MDSVISTSRASEIQLDYMNLLVTQLKNQNPLEPLDNNEMASQLAQFSQLQQLESMNTSFTDVLSGIQRTYAASLIGKEVAFVEEGGGGEAATGVIERVFNNIDGEIVLVAGDETLGLDDIISVAN